jgi:hypothetical protein
MKEIRIPKIALNYRPHGTTKMRATTTEMGTAVCIGVITD